MFGRRPAATCAPAHRAHPVMAKSSPQPPTAHAAGRSNPPANTEHLASSVFSVSSSRSWDHATAWRSVWWRSRPRRDPTSSRNRSSSRSRNSVAVIDCMREAASSIANGIPSRRPQISTTAPASAPVSEIPGATAPARCRNRVAAGDSTPASTSSEGTGHSCSSATRTPSRLVARIFTVAERARIASIRSAAASRTCSQLSNTNSRTLPSNAAATLSATLFPGCWVMPKTAATASGTAAGSVTAASSKTQTPSGNSSRSRPATSSARRVLPTPPTPVSVTNRCAVTASCTSASSDSLPTRLVG